VFILVRNPRAAEQRDTPSTKPARDYPTPKRSITPIRPEEVAHFHGAQLHGANLRKADLGGAYLEEASGLTQGQLEQAFGNEHTRASQTTFGAPRAGVGVQMNN
jgi:hypothetical protein